MKNRILSLSNEVYDRPVKRARPSVRQASYFIQGFSLTVGEKIVVNFNADANKKPGGDCFAVAKDRVAEAWQQVKKEGLTDKLPASPVAGLSSKKVFTMLWNIHSWHKNWKNLPVEYRGKGSAGALAWAGKATAVDQNAIWSGKLLPGAVVQTWKKKDDFIRVRDGEKPESIGHSFIFLNYVYKDGAILGMNIADQGTGWDDGTLKKSTFEFWAGANII